MTKRKGQNRLWIGGTSSLARTYFNAFPADAPGWILLGHAGTPPHWMPAKCEYICYDLLKQRHDSLEQQQQVVKSCMNVRHIVIGIRPPLVNGWNRARNMAVGRALVQGLERLLWMLLLHNNNVHILHMSSVAAIGHLQQQHLVAEDSEQSHVNSSSLREPYDYFKRACEETIDTLASTCKSGEVKAVHVRLGAIFSDDENCIQCSALELQKRVGCYLPYAVDCNSSRNVCHAIRLLLTKQQWSQQYYYYTRPLRHEPQPVCYSDYLIAYRRAHDVWLCAWVPLCVVQAFCCIVNWMARTIVPQLYSAAYLLQVSMTEHSFDCRVIMRDVPELLRHEETILECFVRRRRQLYKHEI